MPNFKCARCGMNIKFESKDYKVAETEKVMCFGCGAEYSIKNAPYPSTKEKLKTLGNRLGKFITKSVGVGLDTLATMQQEYDSAQSRLDDRGIDDWDEETLRWNLNHTGSFYEEAIIRQRLSEKIREAEDNE